MENGKEKGREKEGGGESKIKDRGKGKGREWEGLGEKEGKEKGRKGRDTTPRWFVLIPP